jgi:hypothetical protein
MEEPRKRNLVTEWNRPKEVVKTFVLSTNKRVADKKVQLLEKRQKEERSFLNKRNETWDY